MNIQDQSVNILWYSKVTPTALPQIIPENNQQKLIKSKRKGCLILILPTLPKSLFKWGQKLFIIVESKITKII